MNSRTQEVKKSRSREVEKSRRTSSLVPRSASQHSRVLESLSSLVLEFFAPMSVDHDLLSTAKISTVVHARKDAKTTNSSSLGAKAGDGDGPRSPDVSKPDTKDLLKRMRKVDPNQSKRYRQRTGQ